ncbi:DUF943 family protein [Enterobacteriaceae bacterium ESL0689]|nr:DUF943 family protein [Enterobacteriaceae bacterium ESL0689]
MAKETYIFLIILYTCLQIAYICWLYRPVKIFMVKHKDDGASYVIVDRIYGTDREKIKWWLKHQDMLKEEYNIPNPDSEGRFMVTFCLVNNVFYNNGEGEGSEDTLPSGMEMTPILGVAHEPPDETVFTVYGRGDYCLNSKGKITKIRSE